LAQENIFSQYGYKKWAKENGIGMFYLNDYLRNTEKYQRVYEEYAAPLFQKIDYIGFPMMILVSNTEYDSLSEFTYRSSGSIAPLYRNELLTRTIEINGVNRTIESWIEDKNNPYTEEEREMWNINQFIEAISKQVSSYFTDDYEECEGGYCVPEPESPELPDSEDIPEENGPIVLGEWTSDFHAAKQYSEEHDIPMIVVWGFEGCGFCTSLKTYIDTSTFKDWMAERELVMVYCKDLAYTTYPDAMNFTWDGYNQKLSGAPAMAIYDKRVNSKPFVFYGVYGGSPFGKSADQKAQVFIDYIEDYLNG
jgi:hypothetical protein